MGMDEGCRLERSKKEAMEPNSVAVDEEVSLWILCTCKSVPVVRKSATVTETENQLTYSVNLGHA